MNRLLTLLAVCICCISIFGLKVRLDIYVHDKNEVITTMANKSDDTNVSLFGDVIGGPISLWDYLDKRKSELRKMKQELIAKQQQPQMEQFKTREDILDAIADQIKANLGRRYRTKTDDTNLLYLGLLQNYLINGERRSQINEALRPSYNNARTYGDRLKKYFADGGKELDDVLEDILNYTEPLIAKREGVIDPINYPEDIQKRLADFYNKVWKIYDSGKLDNSGNPKESLENRINQFKAVMDSSDFMEFYGGRPDKWKDLLTDLTDKYIPDDYQPQSEQEQADAYQQYLKKLENSEYTVPEQEPATDEDPVPNAEEILGITNYQENPENQKVVVAPENQEVQGAPNTLPIQDVQGYQGMPNNSGAILNAALSNAGPMYALGTTPGLYGEKYEAFAKALREYALKNGIVSDTPKDPESFKPYIPDFYA